MFEQIIESIENRNGKMDVGHGHNKLLLSVERDWQENNRIGRTMQRYQASAKSHSIGFLLQLSSEDNSHLLATRSIGIDYAGKYNEI